MPPRYVIIHNFGCFHDDLLNLPYINSSYNVTHLWHWPADPHYFKLFIIQFYHHKMLAGACMSTKKYFLEWFSVFCVKYEGNYACRWGQNTPKITVFGHFLCVVDALEVFKLFILILLIKTQLLVPNLWLWGLAFKKFSQKRVKFGWFFVKNRTRKALKNYFYPQNTF